MMTPKTLINLKGSSLNTSTNISSTPSVFEDKTHHRSKLTREDVIMIKLYYHVDHMHKDVIAEKFNVGWLTIHKIVSGKSHKNIPLNFMTKIPERFHAETNYKYLDYKIKGQK
ncbi:hypothetical protein [Salmonella enterica]|uniref:hypothetical protein n=1 Tax=Salmonella enterica TaxID=28901 RepID=UPI003A8094F9